jgi:curli biogenesis system outer membrane secretion channel CsgG
MRRGDLLRGTTRREVVGRGAMLLAGVIAWPAAFSSRAAAQTKMSKAQVNYQETPQGDQRCDNCAHFNAQENTCAVVEGDISPQAWCSLWTA